MSLAEIKEQIAELTPDERLELAALIVHLSRVDDPDYQQELDRRLDRMAAGKKFTERDVEQLHRDLTARGK